MKLFEYEGKNLLSTYGIPVPTSVLISDWEEAPIPYPFVLKAQTLSGGRGKAGGVRVCHTHTEFETAAREIMALKIKGNAVHGLLAEQAVSIQRELYLAITLQGTQKPRLIACASGGMEIEELAKSRPDQIFSEELDPFLGASDDQIHRLMAFLNLEEKTGLKELLKKMQACFFETDALLLEINPLGLVDGKLIALDAKVELDSNAAFRHTYLFSRIEADRNTLKNYQPEVDDGTTITFVPLDGDVALISDGAGTGMLTLDMLYDRGANVASFCELGGTTSANTMYKAMEYTLGSGIKLKSLLIVLIGGFNRMDDMANGIVAYQKDHGLDIPLFVRMVGNMEEEGKRIMAGAGLTTYNVLADAADDAVVVGERG